jgi:hypothetical protein
MRIAGTSSRSSLILAFPPIPTASFPSLMTLLRSGDAQGAQEEEEEEGNDEEEEE